MTLTQYAPLVYSRTAYVDFRPNFIAAPHEWTQEQRARALDFVLAATDYADRLDDTPRWVMFSEGSYTVAGVVTLSRWFSDTLTHELDSNLDGAEVQRRRLFAFVGAVFRKNRDAPLLPTMEQGFYKKIYADTVGPRFFERLSTPNWQLATEIEFTDIDCDTVPPGEAIMAESGVVRIYPTSVEQALWRQVAAGHGNPSLCTNAPPGRHKQLEKFDILTRADVTTIRFEPRAVPIRTAEAKTAPLPRRRSVDASHDVSAWDEDQKKKAQGHESDWSALIPRLGSWRPRDIWSGSISGYPETVVKTAANEYASNTRYENQSAELYERGWAAFVLDRLGINASVTSVNGAAAPLEYLERQAQNQGLLAEIITLSPTQPGDAVVQQALESGAILLMSRGACGELPEQFYDARFFCSSADASPSRSVLVCLSGV